MRQAREWLAPEGGLIASIPNVRHHSVVRSLLQGNWTYESAGLLDRTHLRFFTRREIEKLFHRAGFAIEEMWSVERAGRRPGARIGPAPVQLGRLRIERALASRMRTSSTPTSSWSVPGRAPMPDFGLTSIVIVTHNQLEYTRQCLDSIRRLTDEPYELIVVDNGSTDGTVEYLRALAGVRLIANDAEPRVPGRGQPGDRGRERAARSCC